MCNAARVSRKSSAKAVNVTYYVNFLNNVDVLYLLLQMDVLVPTVIWWSQHLVLALR